MPRARLLVVTPSLGGGGAERHLLRILPKLQAAFDVDVAALRAGGAFAGDLPPGVPLHVVGSLAWFAAARRLRALAARIRPDVVLSVQEAANIPVLIALRRGRADPARVALSTQSAPSVVLADSAWRTRLRTRSAMRRLYPRADRLIAATAGVAGDLSAIAPAAASRISVIPNAGVDATVTTLAREQWAHPFLDAGAPLLVACGRLTEQKDYPTLLRAVAAIHGRRPIRLVILGDGPLEASLGALARELGVDGVVDFAGFVANPYPCMARAAVFVLSSRSEGFGNVLVEALALGVPIVSTDCPYGPREILDAGRCGDLVPPGDPAALAAGIALLLDHPERARTLRELGPGRAAEFSADRSGEAYVRMLDELARQAVSRTR
jgi:glycosyltransferase involved in cell wall biosynthesis